MLFRYPKLSLPRNKLDIIKEKFNCRVSRDINKSDICIISNKFIESQIKCRYVPTLNFSQLFKLFKILKENNYLTLCGLEKVRSIINDFPRDAMFTCPSRYYSYNTATGAQSIVQKYLGSLENDRYCHSIDKAKINTILPILDDNHLAILDSDVCNIIDEDLTVLEIDDFNNIELMVKSNSIDDRSMALEMIANCNIDKSYSLVSYIYFWYYEYLKNSKNWNTVNVKTLRNRMKDFDGAHHNYNISSFNTYLKLLKSKGKLTTFCVNKTIQKLHNTCLSSYIGDKSQIFKVDINSIFLKEEYKNSILQND